MKALMLLPILLWVQTRPMIISTTEAARILGQEVRIASSTTDKKDGVDIERIEYSALEKDVVSGKDIVLYINKSSYPTKKNAHDFMAKVMKENEIWNDRDRLKDLGDEAVFHTDNENFYLIIFRKANTIYSIKINKLTTQADTGELLRILKNLK